MLGYNFLTIINFVFNGYIFVTDTPSTGQC